MLDPNMMELMVTRWSALDLQFFNPANMSHYGNMIYVRDPGFQEYPTGSLSTNTLTTSDAT